MMMQKERFIPVRNHQLYAVKYSPNKPPIGSVQLLHGLAEHSGRYSFLIEALVEAGYEVIRHDHVLHGQSRFPHESIGIWSKNERWHHLIEDAETVYQTLATPTVPAILIGHSMGSIIAREYAAHIKHPLHKLVLLGSLPRVRKQEMYPALVIGTLGSLIQGQKRSKFLYQIISRNTVHAYEHPKAWLTTDQSIIEALNKDPEYGFLYSARFYSQFFQAIHRVNQPRLLKQLPNVPVLFMTGDEDPAGQYGEGVTALVAQIRNYHPSLSITLKRYPGMRHELHNEQHRKLVFADLVEWLS